MPDWPVIRPQSTAEAAEAIRAAAAAGKCIAMRGSGTKSSLGALPDANAVLIETGGLHGVSEYIPGELTFTAAAGTSLAEITTLLAQSGQYLPFDPLYTDTEPCATLGGTVAAGLSGPRRLRYGGLRDFVIGLHYLNGAGTLIRAGGKVVKNAAGYDYPKLFCGSLGTLGLITQVSFKVFPRPQASKTLLATVQSIGDLQIALQQIMHAKAEISALDAWRGDEPLSAGPQPGLSGQWTLAVQIEGARESIGPRVDAIQKLLPASTVALLESDVEDEFWRMLRDLRWIDNPQTILRFYLVPDQLAGLDQVLDRAMVRRVYSLGGNAAWGTMAGDPASLIDDLAALRIKATVWRSINSDSPEILPVLPAAGLVKRVKAAFDADHLFYPGRYAY